MKFKRILVALGGNAIKRPTDTGTEAEMLSNLSTTCSQLASLVHRGHQLCLTHGNGPQVGQIFLRNQQCANEIPPWSLHLCVAQSEGLLGYMFQQQFYNCLQGLGIANHTVTTLVTQTEVSAVDPAFLTPNKPIGHFYSETEARVKMEKEPGVVLKRGSHGWRVVVPSPRPIRILEASCLHALCQLENTTVIAAGGGGVPVLVHPETGVISGCDAVIDKDFAAVVLSREAKSDLLMLVTNVDRCYVEYGKPQQMPLKIVTVAQAKQWLLEDQFQEGSMKPKVEACIQFVEETSNPAVITSLENVSRALLGNTGEVGTWFVQ